MDVKMKKIILCMFAFLLALNFASAQITVEKSVPEKINFGGIIDGRITINNNGSAINAVVYETIVEAEAITPELNYYTAEEGVIDARPPQFVWNITLNNGQNNLSFKIKPLSVGFFTFSPTVVSVGGNNYYSEPASTEVISVPDGKCNLNDGENYITSEDCPSGSADNLCDGIADRICDPDCESNGDIDCGAITGATSLGITGASKGRGIINPSTIAITLLVVLFIALKILKKKKMPAAPKPAHTILPAAPKPNKWN